MEKQLLKDLENIENCMIRLGDRADIWQDRMIYVIAKAVFDLLRWAIRKEKLFHELEQTHEVSETYWKMDKMISSTEAFRVLSDYYHHRTETQADALREALALVPEAVVRCENCIYWEPTKLSSGNCGRAFEITAYKDDYCSYGERGTR